MGETTLPISEQTKELLSEHRHPVHDSWDEVLVSLMALAPTIGKMEDGCHNCGEHIHDIPEPTEITVHQFRHDAPEGDDGIQVVHAYCSPECAHEMIEESQKHVPAEPEKVVVGGHEQLRSEFSGGKFFIDAEQREVLIDIPGAFSGGCDVSDRTYEYEGEPVYIYHEDKGIVQSGVIDEIIHEDAHTALILDRDPTVTRKCNPEKDGHPD